MGLYGVTYLCSGSYADKTIDKKVILNTYDYDITLDKIKTLIPGIVLCESTNDLFIQKSTTCTMDSPPSTFVEFFLVKNNYTYYI